MIRRILAFLAALALPLSAVPQSPDAIAVEILAPLLDPAKVATLKGPRPANARLYRVLYWLETARIAGGEPATVIDTAQSTNGCAGSRAAAADKLAITRNRIKMAEFGCFTPEGMAKLRKGGSPTITQGEYTGSGIMLDHVLPRAVVPELAARFYNLEAVPAKVNLAKSAKIGVRELLLARYWNSEGLLSAAGLDAVESVARIRDRPISTPIAR